MDVTGKHIVFCPSSFTARYRTHTNLELVFSRAAQIAGIEAEREPSTAQLLGQGHTPDYCAIKFPKVVNDDSRRRLEQLDNARKCLEEAKTVEDKQKFQNFVENLLRRLPPGVKGVGIDVSMLKDITAERWLDVSGIHMTAKSRLDTQFTFYKNEVLTEEDCRRNFDPIPDYKDTPSPGVAAAQVAKHKKYAPMLRTAVVQHSRKLRRTLPIFFGCIASHEGEWSDDTHSAIEFTAMSRYADVANGPKRRDGLTPEHASATN
jgi:hypothetical protein